MSKVESTTTMVILSYLFVKGVLKGISVPRFSPKAPIGRCGYGTIPRWPIVERH
jgi:hypothetical protein